MSQRCTLVAVEGGEVVAFAELKHDGHLDMFFCHKNSIGRGVGRALYQAVEANARELGLDCIFADVSITARSFFERCGFVVQ
jgi:N-acetylglutamate synthase-like GNAT family acetyltransferase